MPGPLEVINIPYRPANRARVTRGRLSHSTRHALSILSATPACQNSAEAQAQLKEKVQMHIELSGELERHPSLSTAHEDGQAPRTVVKRQPSKWAARLYEGVLVR